MTITYNTAGEARAKLLSIKQSTRAKSYDKRIYNFRTDEQTESDLALASFDDGWNAGYEAGFQTALNSVTHALQDTIKAQRSGIMAKA